MPNVKYSELLNDVLPQLTADPSDPVTEHAIKRSCIEFCAGSWIWRHMPDPIDVEAGEAYYDIELESGVDMSALLDVTYNNVQLKPKSLAWLDANIPAWRTTQAAVKYYTQVDTLQVILAPVPADNITGGLSMTMALQPSQTSTGIPSWIFNQFMYTLAEGAIARLMLMPGKPWSDPAMGIDHRQRFAAGIANARAQGVSALGRAPLRSSYQH